MAKRVVTRVYRLRHAGDTSGWGYHMPSDGPTWFATRKAAQAYAAKMARTGGSFGRPFSTTIEPFGPSVGWASSNESRESNLRDAESALGVQFRRSGQPRRVGAKRKAGGKTSTRKRVPSKRVANPDDIDAKIGRLSLEAATMTHLAVNRAYAEHKAKKNEQTFLLIFTDGQPSDPEALRNEIISITNDVKDEKEFRIAFITVGQRSASLDAYLTALDDDLTKAGAKYDIVDVKRLEEVDFMAAVNGALTD